MMEVLSVRQRKAMFVAALEVDTGLIQLHFPLDTLEWRAAEYQIEPMETDLLMDIVLYERFIERRPDEVPALWSAPSVEEARTLHVARVMAAKERQRPNGPNSWKNKEQRLARFAEAGVVSEAWLDSVREGDALVPIRDGHVMDMSVLLEKAKLVEKKRSNIKMAAAPALFGDHQPAANTRAASLRQMRELGE